MFSLDEDIRIVDISNNPEYVNRVPLSVCHDTVNTGNFGKKMGSQVQIRYILIRKSITKRADTYGLALSGDPGMERVHC
jgi:hypothetical protein